MYIDDRNYTAMRLENTVVRDKKEGVLVTVVDVYETPEGLMAIVNPFGNNKARYETLLCDLDLSSPPLGNVTYKETVVYVARLPLRNDWRQGLRRENLVYVFEGRLYKYLLPSLSVLKTPVYNKYPTYKKCLGKNKAFSRTFSLDKEGNIWYKCRDIVGHDFLGTPKLDEKYTWLEEALQDALK